MANWHPIRTSRLLFSNMTSIQHTSEQTLCSRHIERVDGTSSTRRHERLPTIPESRPLAVYPKPRHQRQPISISAVRPALRTIEEK